MNLLIQSNGVVRFVYDESIDLSSLGELFIQRASHVEPDSNGQWIADLDLMYGPVLGPFPKRSDALTAEQAWLERQLFENGR